MHWKCFVLKKLLTVYFDVRSLNICVGMRVLWKICHFWNNSYVDRGEKINFDTMPWTCTHQRNKIQYFHRLPISNLDGKRIWRELWLKSSPHSFPSIVLLDLQWSPAPFFRPILISILGQLPTSQSSDQSNPFCWFTLQSSLRKVVKQTSQSICRRHHQQSLPPPIKLPSHSPYPAASNCEPPRTKYEVAALCHQLS